MSKLLACVLIFGGIFNGISGNAAASFIYRETFGNSTASNANQSAYDWALHTGTTGSYSAGAAVSSSFGKVGNVGNINAGNPTSALPNGNFFSSTNERLLFWTSEYSLNPTDYAADSLQFSWYQGNANTADAVQLAIRIGSQWYVSTQSFTNNAAVTSGANFALGDANGNGGAAHGGELKTLTFSLAAANWTLLNFDGTFSTSGTVLSLGSTLGSDLPSGEINAFGWYFNSPMTGSVQKRLDTMAINAEPVPEPSTLALAGFGLAMLGWRMIPRRREMAR